MTFSLRFMSIIKYMRRTMIVNDTLCYIFWFLKNLHMPFSYKDPLTLKEIDTNMAILQGRKLRHREVLIWMRNKRKIPNCKLCPAWSPSAFPSQTVRVWLTLFPCSRSVCVPHHVNMFELKLMGCGSSGLLCSCSNVEMTALKNEVVNKL